jgi:hypothetical protein
MKQFLFPENGRFYKANLHCHTTLSDGNLTPEEIKAAYLERGYSVIAFTDHEALLDHTELCDTRFIALNGYETAIKETNGVSTHDATAMPVHHVSFIKKRPHDTVQFCFYPENFTAGRCKEQIPFLTYVGGRCEYAYTPEFFKHLTSEAHKNGCLVHYNHPAWSLQDAESLSCLEGIDGLELLNTGCRYHGDYGDRVYEQLLRRGKNYYVVAGDDNHNDGHGFADSFGGFTMVCAERFTYEGITEALEKGNSYVSSGPEIHEAYIKDSLLIIRTSPAAQIILHSEGRETLRVHGEGGYVDAAAFPLNAQRLGRYFRIEVIDQKGEHAYTRAYLTEDYAN